MECLRGVPDKNRCKVFKVRKDKQKPTVDAATEEKNNQFILKRFGPGTEILSFLVLYITLPHHLCYISLNHRE